MIPSLPQLLHRIRTLKKKESPPENFETLLSDIESFLGSQVNENPATSGSEPEVSSAGGYTGNDFLFRSIVQDAAIGVAVFFHQKVLYANSKLLDMFKFPDRNLADMTYSDFFCDRASARTRSVMEQRELLMGNGVENLEPFIGEFSLVDGQKMFLEVHSKPFRTNGETWRICFMIDVTERLLTRTELDQRMHRYEGILSGTDAGTWQWNLLTRSGIYNDKWASMIGYELDEISRLTPEEMSALLHPDDTPMVEEKLTNVIKCKTELVQFEARLRHKDGHWVWFHSRGRVTDWDSDGKPLIMSGANIDVSEMKLAEAKLLMAKDELEKTVVALRVASQAKEDFLSTMSHEIRTPLNAVIGLTNLLLRRNPRVDQLEIVKTLKLSSDNLLHLVNDILDYSKIHAGKVQLENVRFNVRELLEYTYATFKLDAQDRGIELMIKADSEIPDVLEGDVTRLTQIIINLMSNALKFTKKGKVSLSASLVDTEEGYCTIRFVITDTGIGIAPEKIDTIFEPFRQSDASIAREFGGTGLGLSIVDALVKIFNGTLTVSSVPGVGSSFSVELKLREGSPVSDNPTIGAWELPFETNNLKVLYVEDVESNRFLVKNIMEEFNLSCTIAGGGREALEETLKKKFDVILMDIQMPDMDGYQTVARIKSQPGGKNNDTPIIAFTAEPITQSLRMNLRKHHMADVISKPFDIDQFMEKITSFANNGSGPGEYSFNFYERGDMVNNIRTLVADELENFSSELLNAFRSNSIVLMQAEIHKLHPIIKNLQMLSVSILLDELKSFGTIKPAMLDIILNIRTLIANVVTDLRRQATSKNSNR